MIKIKLFNKDEEFLIDDEDLPKILQHKVNWFLNKNKNGYVTGWSRLLKKSVFLSRLILNYFGDEYFVDHIDNNHLNNQKSNLRLLSPSDNSRRSKQHGKPNIRQMLHKNGLCSYRLSFHYKQKTVFDKCFNTYEEAEQKYNELVLQYSPKVANEILNYEKNNDNNSTTVNN